MFRFLSNMEALRAFDGEALLTAHTSLRVLLCSACTISALRAFPMPPSARSKPHKCVSSRHSLHRSEKHSARCSTNDQGAKSTSRGLVSSSLLLVALGLIAGAAAGGLHRKSLHLSHVHNNGHSTVHAASSGRNSISDSVHRRSAIEEGWTARIQDFPYAAMIVQPSTMKYLCTGTLIHPRIVLTAAHCIVPDLDGSPNPVVLIGKEGKAQRFGYQRLASRSLVHPRFKPGSFDCDVAALILDEDASEAPARLVSEGQPLGFEPPSSKSGPLYHNWYQAASKAAQDTSVASELKQLSKLDLVVIGWGATEDGQLPSVLQQGRVTPVPLDKCQQLFNPYNSQVTPRMVCATGRTCAGDSGGPLLKPDSDGLLLVGQVSFGFPRKDGQGCPNPNPATAFTDLSAPRIQQWLKQVVIGRELPKGVGSSWQDSVNNVLSSVANLVTGRDSAQSADYSIDTGAWYNDDDD